MNTFLSEYHKCKDRATFEISKDTLYVFCNWEDCTMEQFIPSKDMRKYLDKIKNSVDFSKIYTNNSEFDQNKQKTENTINQIIERLDSVLAVKKYSKFGKVAVLNFASFKHPGGGFINGSMAQEEALCHESTLYNVIADDTFSRFYNYNNHHLNRGMYHNRAIYSPNIAFTGENDEIVAYADVITCACPNYSYYIKMKVSPSENLLTLKSRIGFVKKILVENRLHYSENQIG